MAAADEQVKSEVLDSEGSRRRPLKELFDMLGIRDCPVLSAKEIREQMIREGVRPEDNIGSRAIIAMRNGDPLP